MRKIIILVSVIALIVLLSLLPKPTAQTNLETIRGEFQPEMVFAAPEVQKPVTEPEKRPDTPKKTEQQLRDELIARNPFDCDLTWQVIVWPDGNCSPTEKPQPVAPATPVNRTTSCEAYRSLVAQYDWNVDTMLAICQCESGGNPNALNPVPPDYSVGLFQINLYGALAASRPSEAALYDPATNVATAYGIWKAQGYGGWTCYYKI